MLIKNINWKDFKVKVNKSKPKDISVQFFKSRVFTKTILRFKKKHVKYHLTTKHNQTFLKNKIFNEACLSAFWNFECEINLYIGKFWIKIVDHSNLIKRNDNSRVEKLVKNWALKINNAFNIWVKLSWLVETTQIHSCAYPHLFWVCLAVRS